MAINTQLSKTIEIKNVKVNESLSRESYCFEASVYIDGKRVMMAFDEGCGGCVSFQSIHNDGQVDCYNLVQSLGKEASKLDGSHPSEAFGYIISELVGCFLLEKDVKKLLKKIVYVKKGEIYTLSSKYKPTPDNLERVKKSTWFDDSYVLLNEKDFDEVVAIYKEKYAI